MLSFTEWKICPVVKCPLRGKYDRAGDILDLTRQKRIVLDSLRGKCPTPH